MRVTNNGGASWTGRTCPIAVGDIAVKDQYTAYVSLAVAGGTVTSTANGGWTWQPIAAVTLAAGTITDLKLDVATGHLLAGLNNGRVYLSTDGNATYRSQGTPGIGGANAIVAFDPDYASNNIIYAADTVTAGAAATDLIYRFEVGTYTAWLALGSVTPEVAAGDTIGDMVVAPDGTLYVSDLGVANGFSRSVNPTDGTATASRATWDNQVGLGLGVAVTIGGLALAEGSNVIYGIDVAGPAVYTYTDTLSATITAPVPVAPVGGPVVDAAANAVVLSWEAVTGALTYRVRYDTRDDFRTATTTIPAGGAGPDDPASPRTSLIIAAGGLRNGATYYWEVRVQTPIVGPYCDAQTFLTQLGALATNTPNILNWNAIEGGVGPGGWNASLTPTFSWGAIANATNYEFQLASDAGMTSFIKNLTGANALGAVTSYSLTGTKLAYSTTYYWKVKAISATSLTDWTAVIAFTTLAEPVKAPAPTPAVEIKEVPAPVIEIKEAAPLPNIVLQPPETKEIAPAYIWAIIIIGAVLVIAVIVLIVRTRRSV